MRADSDYLQILRLSLEHGLGQIEGLVERLGMETVTLDRVRADLREQDNWRNACAVETLESDLIVIDDIGYVRHTRSEMEVLFNFFAERYERGSLMITSNLSFFHWDQIFHDRMTANLTAGHPPQGVQSLLHPPPRPNPQPETNQDQTSLHPRCGILIVAK